MAVNLPVVGEDPWGTKLNTAIQGLDTRVVVVEGVPASAPLVQTINAQTGTTYTPVVGDSGKIVTLSNAAAITVTLPSDATAALPVGSRVDFVVIAAGMATFVAGSGATANGTPSLVTRAQWSSATAIKRAANTWVVVGDLA